MTPKINMHGYVVEALGEVRKVGGSKLHYSRFQGEGTERFESAGVLLEHSADVHPITLALGERTRPPDDARSIQCYVHNITRVAPSVLAVRLLLTDHFWWMGRRERMPRG